ncbi:flagellar biosynthesis protein FlhF [Geothrix sp.]|jgi:flagellar biosynthesis protein FlhF|uniref:flagellar biosynthesis protein FlhF n=1 Tax=Geothrix sp. TaxID=1962974 RepID=UPI0025B88848|nr:flagellar biosynthesis protein FlhF [Geothrix sp.]
MRVKTFEAGSMQDALDIVKKEMGEEAFILSTRTRRRPSALGLGLGEEAVIEVTAAVDEAQPGAKLPSPPLAAGSPASLTYGLRPSLEPAPPRPPARPPVRPPVAPPAPPMDLQPLRRELLEIKGAVAALKDNDQRNASILKELDQMKALLSRIQRQGMPPAQLHLPPSLLELYGDLVANDVEPLVALRLCEYAQRALVDQDGDSAAGAVDAERARLFLRRVIADFIPVAPPIQLDPGKMRVAALVGPTGVGKTTTLAKLAAYAQLHLKQKVALLTLDTYRMAAVDQLQQYAQILQVPLHVALTVEDLRSALRFYQDRALVLIDTPGHSPKDTETLGQLRGLLDELPEVETHLVMSATTKPRDLAEIAARYEPLHPTRLLFTKLDETSTYGPILSTLVRVKRPLSYLGTGQEVPEALELATSRRVADLILPATVKEAE